MSMGVQSQINLLGASINPVSGAGELLNWQAFDSLSVRVIPTILDGYFTTTSSFDALNGEYYITGISGDSTGLYSYNTGTGTENLMTASAYANINEFDMSTGKMYNLVIDSTDYINVYEYDVNSNQDTFRGSVYEPGINFLYTDAISFDSNNGIIYYVGPAIDSFTILYAISVRGGFSYTKTRLTTTAPISYIYGVNFDNVNEKIYAVNDTYDSLFASTERNVVEINKTTGDVIVLRNLNEFPYYVIGSSSFDQSTSTYLVVCIDTSGVFKMIGLNTLTSAFEAGFVPSTVSEIVCDNSVFARRTYGSTYGITQSSASSIIRLYPNPVTDVLSIDNTVEGPVTIQIFSSLGQQVFVQDYSAANTIRLNLASLSPGLYVVNLRTNEQTISEKILVQ